MFHENSHHDKGATERSVFFCVLQNRFWGNVCLRLDKKLQENGCLLCKRQKGPYGNVALSPKSIAHKVVVSRTLYFLFVNHKFVYKLCMLRILRAICGGMILLFRL